MKTGFYVEGKYFGANEAQARARARAVSSSHLRPVAVTYMGPTMGITRFAIIDAGLRPDPIQGARYVQG
jgi:hypothetical protein